MVALSMSHRYSTGTLAATGVTPRVDARRHCRAKTYHTARVEIRGQVVDAVVEDFHVEAFARATARKGVGCRILMEHDGTWNEWTVHHIAESATWDRLAEPRIKPILMPWEREEAEQRQALAA